MCENNRITPGVYIHIVTGRYAKEVLPWGPPTRITICGQRIINTEVLPTQHQYDRLHKAGFKKLKGLTRNQAEFLINLSLKMYFAGLPLPWQYQALINKGLGKHMSVRERYVWLRNTKREKVEELLAI